MEGGCQDPEASVVQWPHLCLLFLPRTSNVWLVMGCCSSAAAWWARSVCGMLRLVTASLLFPNQGEWGHAAQQLTQTPV